MTDISVIKMIISKAVWRIYPSWVNDELRAWEGLGHWGMFWARLSRDDFRSTLEIISFHSRVMFVSKSFLVSRAFERFGAKRSSSGTFCFDDALEIFLKTPLRHRAFFFCELRLRPGVFFWKFPFFFPKQSRCYLPDSYGDQWRIQDFEKGGGGQEEAEGVSCRSECGCSRNSAALGRSSSCLGGPGASSPGKFWKFNCQNMHFFTHFEGLDSLSSWRQYASFLYPNPKPDHSFYTRAHNCALLSIEKKDWGSPERGGGHGPFAPPPPLDPPLAIPRLSKALWWWYVEN